MSGLRQVVSVSQQDASPEEDIEAPKEKGQSTSETNAAANHVRKNPVFLARAIFRKVLVLLVATDEKDITQPGGIVTLIKDILVGIILGVICVSALIILDHRNVIHFQSARRFRKAAFRLLNDPETIANLEESTEYKFISMDEYEENIKEIKSAAKKLVSLKPLLEIRTAEAEKSKKEVEPIRVEWETVTSNPLLMLDKFCGGCRWGATATCQMRVDHLQNMFQIKPIVGRVRAMSRESCIKKD
mmetsp:Transcript_45677/g.95860  ORF Transcript_45677/g.95860 Transcript_45677/m.95860 type:complete len:244 (+) Transcript_45677:116-847(+)